MDNSDDIAELMTSGGWVDGEELLYIRLPLVTHEWQPQRNSQAMEFLMARPLPLEFAAP